MLFNLLKRLAFPHFCVVCEKHSGQLRDLCQDCQAKLPWVQQACRYCAHPLPILMHPNICGPCLKKPPYYDYLITACRYAEPLAMMITRLKFHHQLVYAQLLGELLADKLSSQFEASLEKPDLIIPVPLHQQRLRQRGFNQALEIARPLAKQFKIKLDYQSCQRQKATQAQSSLPAEERRRNIKDAFAILRPLPKRIAIVDDVVTTGHTVNELSHCLKKSGVEHIQVWTCAKTLLSG